MTLDAASPTIPGTTASLDPGLRAVLRSAAAVPASAAQLRRLHDAITSMGSDLELEAVLRRIVDAAVELLGARYGAVGVLDDERTHIVDFITSGIGPTTATGIGALPTGHGILGLPIADPRPLRLDDLNRHASSFGFPPGHPPMTSFLGVPVFVGGRAFGNLYLTEKRNGQAFTAVDEELAVALAVAAGLALEKARLHARLRRSDVIEDRDRIARDLHDTVVQSIFATGLSLHRARAMAETLPEVTRRIDEAIDELDRVVRAVRTTVFELHVTAAADGGIRQRLLRVGDRLTDALGFRPTFDFDGPVDAAVSDALAPHLLAVVGEALANVARHAGSPSASVLVRADPDILYVQVDDEGAGPGLPRIGGHGMANLIHRAESFGGSCTLEARIPCGSRLRFVVPVSAPTAP